MSKFFIVSNHQKFYKALFFVVFIILYAFFLLFLCNELNIWEDEAYSLDTTSHGFSYALHQSYSFEGQPPVYFLILTLWRILNNGIFFARLLSILFIFLAAYVIFRTVRLFSDVESALWIAVLFLLNPFSVWAALEIRTYSLLILLSSLSILFLYKFYFEKKNKFIVLFLLSCLIGLYTQYFFVFLIIAFSISEPDPFIIENSAFKLSTGFKFDFDGVFISFETCMITL